MSRYAALPKSLFLAIGGLLGLLSLLMPWFYFAETGTTFDGQWGFGPSFYSELPVKEDPQTSAGLSLQRNLSSPSTPFWIWHELSFWLMITTLVSILVLSLVRGKARTRSFGIRMTYLFPFSLMILSLIAWGLFVNAAVENVCIGSACLSGFSGSWTGPAQAGSATTTWGMGVGFFVSMAATAALLLAGSTGLINNRHSAN